MVDKKSGQAEYAVMSFGGLFGLGDNYYPLPGARSTTTSTAAMSSISTRRN